MKIRWFGQTAFCITVSQNKGEKTEIIIDSFEKKLKSENAGVLLLTRKDKGQSGPQNFSFVIEAPGEYEINNIFFQGIEAFNKKEEAITFYLIEAEGIVLCHLGNFGQKELSPEQEEKLSGVDVLLVPVGGGDSLSAREAAEIVSLLEPKLVIPMDYPLSEKQPRALKEFLEAKGAKPGEEQTELNIKKSDLEEDGARVITLKP